MITADRLRRLRTEVSRHAPVLSLYLDVNPGNPENARRAWLLRARAAMEALDAPHGLARRWLERLRRQAGPADARTLVAFASDGADALWETLTLRFSLPLLAAHGGAIARWGEPYLAPLLLAEREPRYLALLVAEARVRFFALHLGEACELPAAVQPLDETGWRDLGESSTGAPGVPARGGSGKDHFERRVADWRRRFRKDAGHRAEAAAQQVGADHLLLLGAADELPAFEEALPAGLQARVAARLGPPADPDAPVAALEGILAEAAAQADLQRGRELIGAIRERGVWGFGPTLEAVEEGRVHVLAVPWHLHGEVARSRESGRLAATRAEAEAARPGEGVTTTELAAVLPEIAERHGTQLVVLHDDNEAALERDLGGLGGILRW